MPIQTTTFAGAKLLPLYKVPPDQELPVNLAPSTTYERGRILGKVANAANDAQTLTVTGTPTGGTITIGVVDPLTGAATTFSVAYNAATSAAQTAVRAALGNADVAVTGSGALPGNTHVYTFTGRYAGQPVPVMTISANGLTGGTTPAASFAHTTTGRTADTYGKYDDSTYASAACILPYACATDASGNIYLGDVAAGFPMQSIACYFGGDFDTTELVGLDANAVADLGRLKSGTAAAGILSVR